jgi:hypothetical protein
VRSDEEILRATLGIWGDGICETVGVEECESVAFNGVDGAVAAWSAKAWFIDADEGDSGSVLKIDLCDSVLFASVGLAGRGGDGRSYGCAEFGGERGFGKFSERGRKREELFAIGLCEAHGREQEKDKELPHEVMIRAAGDKGQGLASEDVSPCCHG